MNSFLHKSCSLFFLCKYLDEIVRIYISWHKEEIKDKNVDYLWQEKKMVLNHSCYLAIRIQIFYGLYLVWLWMWGLCKKIETSIWHMSRKFRKEILNFKICAYIECNLEGMKKISYPKPCLGLFFFFSFWSDVIYSFFRRVERIPINMLKFFFFFFF